MGVPKVAKGVSPLNLKVKMADFIQKISWRKLRWVCEPHQRGFVVMDIKPPKGEKDRRAWLHDFRIDKLIEKFAGMTQVETPIKPLVIGSLEN